MFISKRNRADMDKPYYVVLESYRENGAHKKRYYGALGHYPTLPQAYDAALSEFLKVSARLEQLEGIYNKMNEKRD